MVGAGGRSLGASPCPVPLGKVVVLELLVLDGGVPSPPRYSNVNQPLFSFLGIGIASPPSLTPPGT